VLAKSKITLLRRPSTSTSPKEILRGDTDEVAPLGGSRMHSLWDRGRRDDNGDVSSDPEQRLRRFAANLEKRDKDRTTTRKSKR
jgi:hypothetical protein